MLRRIILVAAAIGAALAIALLIPAGSPAETADAIGPLGCGSASSIRKKSSPDFAPSSRLPVRATNDVCRHTPTNA